MKKLLLRHVAHLCLFASCLSIGCNASKTAKEESVSKAPVQRVRAKPPVLPPKPPKVKKEIPPGPALIGGHSSIQALAEAVIPVLLTQSKKDFEGQLIQFEEYESAVHPHLPEAERMSAETKWRAFTNARRPVNTNIKFSEYNNNGYTLESVGAAEKVYDYGHLKVHRRIKMSLRQKLPAIEAPAENARGPIDQVVHDDGIFGVVIEKNGQFKLYNILQD
jgi:hypothetical protein